MSGVCAGGPVAIDLFPNMVGIGVGALSDYSGSDGYVGGAEPGARYTFEGTHRYIDWWGSFGTANLINSPNWQAGPLLSYAWPAVIWRLDKSWALGAGFMYQKLSGDAADSPVVKDRGNANQFIGGLGLGYLW